MTSFRTLRSWAAFLALSLVVAPAVAGAATITIVNNNAPGVGFNDPSPRAPVGGNPGTTLGDQRLNVFNYAAGIWGGVLPSSVVILVRAQFAAQTCTATSATLGSTSSVTSHRDFTGAILPGHWYSQSLANRLAGVDLSPTNPDINTTFNSQLDAGLGAACLGGATWYYGFDGNEGTNVELLPVVLHELGHGFNFSTTTSGTSGNFSSGFPSVYDHYLTDGITGRTWDDAAETAAQRVASAISVDKLVWGGTSVNNAAATSLSHRPRLLVNSGGPITGAVYTVQTASFGPAINATGVTGDVVMVTDTSTVTDPNDGCDPITNGPSLVGKIALINRGICTFVVKVKAAQDAGAIAVIVVNNVAAGLPGMGGSDPSITIPSVGISQADGNAIKANLAGGVNVTMNLDPVYLAGADNSGRVLMYAPNPFAGGSSVSHYDVSLTPNALMEPNINNDLHINLDLTPNLFEDIGWFFGVVATELARFTAESASDGILVRWQFSNLTDVATITLQRGATADGAFESIQTDLSSEGAQTLALDRSAAPGTTWYYRLRYSDRTGTFHMSPTVSATRAGTYLGPAVLQAPSPNPASRGTSVKFRVGKPEFVRLTVTDASGRQVRTLQNGMLLAGEYTRDWDGMSDRSVAASPGLYFISLRTSAGVSTQRLALIR
jgi:hypothetical protein